MLIWPLDDFLSKRTDLRVTFAGTALILGKLLPVEEAGERTIVSEVSAEVRSEGQPGGAGQCLEHLRLPRFQA